jgi:hypothetical protein
MGKLVLLGAVAALLSTPCFSQALQVFSDDPVPGSTDQFFFNAFMQLDNIPPFHLHSGEDIGLSEGEPVYPPIQPGSLCMVRSIGVDWVTLEGAIKQDGDNALCILLHLYPNTNLTVGSWIGPETWVGDINGQDHLHFELLLSPDDDYGEEDMRSPRRHSLCLVAWWRADSTPPEITQNTVVHTAPIGSPSVWQIWVADPAEAGDPPIYNGIGGMQLMIDGDVVDEFDFDAFVSKSGQGLPEASEFYYDTTPPPGNNNPNTLQYKLSWVATDDHEHVWRLRWWDARCNTDEGDPEHPPVAPLLAGEMGGDIWFEGGVMKTAVRWRVSCLAEIDHFDVLRGPDSDGNHKQANLEPILAVDGQMDYEFADSLPEGWTNVWYVLTADDLYGNSYEMGRTHLVTDMPTRAGISLYPNPSHGTFAFQVSTPRDCVGSLAIYNAAGRRVRTLHEGSLRSGTRLWSWDGRDARGDLVGQGIYFVRLATEDEMALQKLTVLR